MTEHRAEFDAEVTFLNGGGLQAQGFRLDVPGPDVSESQLAAAFVRQLGLLMTDRVTLSSVRVFQEPHKGLRGQEADQQTAGQPTRLVELSHVISAGMVTFPGLPGPELTPHLSREDSRSHYAPGTEFEITRFTMVGNTGTYLDSPFHRHPDGADLAGLPLEHLADLPAVVARVTPSDGQRVTSRGIGVGALAALDVAGRAVLLHTGWDRHFGTSAYGESAPYLTAEGARWLVENGARLVGIDSVNIDDAVPHGPRPAHTQLLAAGIPIVEHLTGLDQLPATGARFTAVPPRVANGTTFSVRAFAIVPG